MPVQASKLAGSAHDRGSLWIKGPPWSRCNDAGVGREATHLSRVFLVLPNSSPLDVMALQKNGVADLVKVNLTAMIASIMRTCARVFKVSTASASIYKAYEREQHLPTRKLLAAWPRPFRVIEAKSHAFVIEYLHIKLYHEVHGTHLNFYHDASLEETEELRELVSEHGIELSVEVIQDHRIYQAIGRLEVRVKWASLKEHDSSWEGLLGLQQDIRPSLLEVRTTGGISAVSASSSL